jgi:hypothetical protein
MRGRSSILARSQSSGWEEAPPPPGVPRHGMGSDGSSLWLKLPAPKLKDPRSRPWGALPYLRAEIGEPYAYAEKTAGRTSGSPWIGLHTSRPLPSRAAVISAI